MSFIPTVASDATRSIISDITGEGARQEGTRRYTRSPEDVLRLIVFGLITLVLLALTRWAQDSIVGFEEDLIELLGFVSSTIERVLKGGVEIAGVVVGLGLYLVPLITKRYRLFGYIALSSLLASAMMWGVQKFVERDASQTVVNELAERAGIAREAASASPGLAATAASFIAVAPFVSQRWRRFGVVYITIVTLVSVVVSARLPADAFVALPLGAICGTVVLLAFGRPDRRPTLDAIGYALADAGLPTSEVRQAKVDARGSTPYFATLDDGSGLFVKVLGPQERAADLMFRVYRFLRLKNVGDDRPFSSLRRTIEHEALIALLARDVGVRTPRLTRCRRRRDRLDAAGLRHDRRRLARRTRGRCGHRRADEPDLGSGRHPAPPPHRSP